MIEFPGLRPSPDRVRETLFNWLRRDIEGATCLDLFAGSGILSFEAVSRGAANAILVEREPQLVEGLRQQASLFDTAQAMQIECADAMVWTTTAAATACDIVFLDPPFGRQFAEKACELLVNNGYLRQNALVYVESEPGLVIEHAKLQQLKLKTAGQVQYQLLKYNKKLE